MTTTASIRGPNAGRGLAQQVVADGAHVDGCAAAGRPAGRALQPGVASRTGGTSPEADSSSRRRGGARRPPGRAAARSGARRCRRRARAACRSSAGSPPARGAVVARQAAHLVGLMPQTARAPAAIAARARAAQASRRRGGPGSRGPASRSTSSCIRPSASAHRCRAAGRCAGGTCRPSRCAAGRCRPASRRRLACWAKVQKCRLLVMGCCPQMRISRLSA